MRRPVSCTAASLPGMRPIVSPAAAAVPGARPLVFALLSCCLLSSIARQVQCHPARDAFLDAPSAGNYLHVAGYTLGLQTSFENRTEVEPGMSMLHTRLTGVLAYPYAESSLDLNFRAFFLNVGAASGYRWVHRDHSFDPGEARTLQARRDRESHGSWGSRGFGFYEGRINAIIPLDPLFMLNTLTFREELLDISARQESFDWQHATVHARGLLVKYELTLLHRDPGYGAAGLYLRYMSSPRQGEASWRQQEFHYGFVAGTRPGFVKTRSGNSDYFAVFAVFNLSGEEFGLHGLALPVYALAAYRVTLGLDPSHEYQARPLLGPSEPPLPGLH